MAKISEVLQMVEEGEFVIFPFSELKRPLVFNPYKFATSDRDTIIAWWKEWPKALIGVPLERNDLVVYDYEGPNDGTRPRLPGSPVINTTPRGAHFIYENSGHYTPKSVPPYELYRGMRSIIWWPSEGFSCSSHSQDIGGLPKELIEDAR